MANIVGFFIGGTVSVDASGRIVKALYDAGANNIQFDPLYDAVVLKEKKKPKALSPPAPWEATGIPRNSVEAALAFIEHAGKPVHRREIMAAVDAVGGHGKFISTALNTLMKRGKIERTGSATYQLAEAKPKTNGGDFKLSPNCKAVHKALTYEPSTPATLSERTEINKNSIGSALATLIKLGLAVKTSPGHYALA